ncbi:hypothetical protein GCM10010400_58240 [Streptomyces aculeolatus]|uniref:hypothetical protein n=1 Tax=Streptomyces aculeolatus TaxID=270689 RepID=UPI001CEC9EE6|nr:hypothetical protein [Streptomyces aculeolatus]
MNTTTPPDENQVRAAIRASEQRAQDEAPTLPPATAFATRYEVSCLPTDHPERHLWNLGVEYRGRGLWAVVRHSQCLGADGEWSWESRPSERTDEWLAGHRFSLEEALRLAEAAAPLVTLNGFTVSDVLRRGDEGEGR